MGVGEGEKMEKGERTGVDKKCGDDSKEGKRGVGEETKGDVGTGKGKRKKGKSVGVHKEKRGKREEERGEEIVGGDEEKEERREWARKRERKK